MEKKEKKIPVSRSKSAFKERERERKEKERAEREKAKAVMEENLAEEYKDTVNIGKCDVDDNADLPAPVQPDMWVCL